MYKKKYYAGTILRQKTQIFNVMKLTLVNFIVFSLSLAANTYSQTQRFTIDRNNVTIAEMLSDIEEMSEFSFLYSTREIDANRHISFQGTDVLITDILSAILDDTEISYRITDKHIVLYKANSLFERSMLSLQGILITGTVTDADGDPLPGASVSIKGTNQGTITDNNGVYSLTVPDANTTLIFSYVGFTNEETVVGNRRLITVALKEDTLLMEEVIVVGYGTQVKKNVTGSISNINSKDIVRSNATLLSGALAGKIQGISTRATDARPGRGISLQIRNMGSPLYVIDGIPYGGSTGLSMTGSPVFGGETSFNALSIEDVESISILKDASAAVYGLRAANGVVLVTTKKGKRDEDVRININGYYGFQNFTRFPIGADAGQYVRGIVESEQNQGRNPASVYSREELAKWELGTDPDYKWYNWFDIVTRPNVPQYYLNGNISGGTQKVNYYLSISRTDQQSIIRDYKWNKTNLQANIETKLVDGLTIGMQISGILDDTYNIAVPGWDAYGRPMNSTLRMWPIEGPYANDNENYLNNTHVLDHNSGFYKRSVAGWKDWFQRNVNVNLSAQYDFKFGLSVKVTHSYNYEHVHFDGKSFEIPAYRYIKETDTYEKQTNVISDWAGFEYRNVASNYSQFQLNYKKMFGEHNIAAMLAAERSYYENSYYLQAVDPASNYISIISFSELSSSNYDNTWAYEARAGYIGRLNYDYKERYLVELLGRYDGSYLYVGDKRWGFFPGVSVGWRFSNEDFFKPITDIVNDAKVRFSWGQTGSESGVSMFGYMSGYNFNNVASVLDGVNINGIRDRGMPVTNLTWITNTSTDIGIDLAFLNRRLTFTADAFQRKRTGIPAARYDVVLPSEVGYTLPNENLNSDAIRGLEGIITYNNNSGDLNYTLSANATFARPRSLKTYKPRFSSSWNEYQSSAIDRWSNITWAYHYIGQFQTVDEINNYPVNIDGQGNRTLLPGDLIYEDLNGDNIINSLDQRPIGYAQGATPFLTFGFNTMLEWKGISLSLDFAGAAMQSLYRSGILRIPYDADWNSPEYLLADRWHKEDPYDNNSRWIPGTYPAVRKGYSSHSNYWNSDFWLTNIRYLRLKNVEIGYSLPKSLIGKIRASQLRIYVNASNLLSFDNVAKFQIDPEISATNAMVYPSQRVIMCGFNMSF